MKNRSSLKRLLKGISLLVVGVGAMCSVEYFNEPKNVAQNQANYESLLYEGLDYSLISSPEGDYRLA